jgi:hypothetical protein
MALQCANISGYTCNCASEKRGFLMRELQRCCVLSTLLTEKTLNKKSPVSSVLNVLQLKGLGVVVSSERLKDIDSMPVGQESALGPTQTN